MKPKIFVGSSIEGLDVAYAIQENLEYIAEVTVWDQGVFQISSSAMYDLIGVINECDFAIFVFHPDDYATIRSQEMKMVRDNVLFESGLFIGKLGLERVFMVKPRDVAGDLPLRIATDLSGITLGTYQSDRGDKRFKAALGPFCNQVRNKINQLGPINSVDLTHRYKKLESFSRFLYYLIQFSKHTQQGYSQILSAFLTEIEMPYNKKGVTLFRLNEGTASLTQIASAGMVNADPISFSLSHNIENPEQKSCVVWAFDNGIGVFEKEKRMGFKEYIYSRRIAEKLVVSIHFLTEQTLTGEIIDQLDTTLYNMNKDIFDSFHVFLKGEVENDK